MTFVTKKRSCVGCGLTFDAYDVDWDGLKVFRQQHCEKCTEAKQKVFEADEKLRIAETETINRSERFKEICPPLYQNTDPLQLNPKFLEAAEKWCFGPKGLAFVGVSGQGKTRAAYWIIRRMLMLGKTIEASNAAFFASLSIDKFSENKEEKLSAKKQLKSLRNADIWLLDDLGKQRMTERVEAELYEILEHRTTHQRPTIWTANAKGKVLRSMFSEERGEPIMRRLTEFSKIVAVWSDDARIQYK